MEWRDLKSGFFSHKKSCKNISGPTEALKIACCKPVERYQTALYVLPTLVAQYIWLPNLVFDIGTKLQNFIQLESAN